MKLHYEAYGEGHPLIILHGLFGSLENWRSLSKTFSQFFHVFAVDQRNHGRSPHSDIANYPAMAEDLREFMQQRALSSAYLLGHSMGGKTAMRFAVTYPETIDKLIIVDITPKAHPPEHEDVFAALYSLDLSALHSRQAADTALARYLPDRSLRQFLLKNLERDISGSFKWRINLDGIYKNYPEILKQETTSRRFLKPTLFIKGGNSEYIQEEDIVTIRGIFPQVQLVSIPQTGHWVHAEAPHEFTRIVLDFLSPQR